MEGVSCHLGHVVFAKKKGCSYKLAHDRYDTTYDYSKCIAYRGLEQKNEEYFHSPDLRIRMSCTEALYDHYVFQLQVYTTPCTVKHTFSNSLLKTILRT